MSETLLRQKEVSQDTNTPEPPVTNGLRLALLVLLLASVLASSVSAEPIDGATAALGCVGGALVVSGLALVGIRINEYYTSPMYWYLRGEGQFREDKYQAALGSFDRALRLKPRPFWASRSHLYEGVCYGLGFQQYHTALAELQEGMTMYSEIEQDKASPFTSSLEDEGKGRWTLGILSVITALDALSDPLAKYEALDFLTLATSVGGFGAGWPLVPASKTLNLLQTLDPAQPSSYEPSADLLLFLAAGGNRGADSALRTPQAAGVDVRALTALPFVVNEGPSIKTLSFSDASGHETWSQTIDNRKPFLVDTFRQSDASYRLRGLGPRALEDPSTSTWMPDLIRAATIEPKDPLLDDASKRLDYMTYVEVMGAWHSNVRKALTAVTGEDFGSDHEKWMAWWQTHEFRGNSK